MKIRHGVGSGGSRNSVMIVIPVSMILVIVAKRRLARGGSRGGSERRCTTRRARRAARVSIDLLELMHKKALNRRQLSSPTVSDDYPIVALKEVQKSQLGDI
ncbi:hypothetical protein KM043_012121 [Ampulex compressa]|nr:hypothetical protein KM043_012121 [Ampulex compressa]